MPVPTSMTEQNVADYMHAVLSDVATDLGFTATSLGSYEEAIYDVALALGVGDVADETDMAKLRTFARLYAWKHALAAASARYDVADGTQSLKRSQMVDGIKEALAEAQSDASGYAEAISGFEVTVTPISRNRDPYVYASDEDRAL